MKFEVGEIALYVGAPNAITRPEEVEVSFVGPCDAHTPLFIPEFGYAPSCSEAFDYIVQANGDYMYVDEPWLRKINPKQKYEEITRGRIHPKETPKKIEPA